MPTFLICGAAKCGTTTLWQWLDDHPEVRMASLKEPRFFTSKHCHTDTAHPSGAVAPGQYENGLDWYMNLFSESSTIRDSYTAAPQGEALVRAGDRGAGEDFDRNAVNPKAFGEATTRYFIAEDSASLIHRHLPDVKLVFILRHPVDRAWSQYWHERKGGWEIPSFSEIMQSSHKLRRHFLLHSHYRESISRYLDLFPLQNILFLLLDDVEDHPAETARQLFDFIGVDPEFTPPGLRARYNVAGTARFKRLQRLIMGRVAAFLARHCPKKIKPMLANLRQKIVRLNTMQLELPDMDSQTRQLLLKELAGETAFIEKLLGRQLGHWQQ